MSISISILYFLAGLHLFISFSVAVPCDEFWGTSDTPPKIKDPFNGDQRWQVVRAEDTYVRFQNPRDQRGIVNGIRQSARVERLQWSATQDEVDNVFDNFNNYFGNNIMLWFNGGMSAYAYSGLIVDRNRDVSAQDGLADQNTVISFILPSGKAKVTEVNPSSNLRNAQRLLAFGLNGDLLPNDYAYTQSGLVHAALIWRSLHRGVVQPSGAWSTAETNDPNECVIIDYRGFSGLTWQPDGRIFWG